MRLRLAAFLVEEPILCERCGVSIVGRSCAYAFCCASRGSALGHYVCRDAFLHDVHIVDASATTGEQDLIPSQPTVSLADISISVVLPGGRAALDVR